MAACPGAFGEQRTLLVVAGQGCGALELDRRFLTAPQVVEQVTARRHGEDGVAGDEDQAKAVIVDLIVRLDAKGRVAAVERLARV